MAWAKASLPYGSYISAAVRYEVWDRDEGMRAFVSTTGRRGRSRYQVQFHRLHPSGKVGSPNVDAIAIRSAQNLHAAEQDYRREHVARKIVEARSQRGEKPDTVR